jgi:hypothetical protein
MLYLIGETMLIFADCEIPFVEDQQRYDEEMVDVSLL